MYLATAREKYEEIDSAERYKEEDLAKALTSAREALLRDGDWLTLVNAAIKHKLNNIIHWPNKSKLTEWIDDNAAEANSALSKLWSDDDRTPGDRVGSFDVILPETVFPRTAVGTRLNAASYLMMAIDPHSYPPYRRTPFRDTYQRLGYPPPAAGDVGSEYEYALDFLDRVLEEARRRGMDRPSTRLDAQSVVWQLRGWQGTADHEPERGNPGVPTSTPPVRHDLNTILYGPPGTGKTWRTTALSLAIVDGAAESPDPDVTRFRELREIGRIRMVTFHQNFAYEDFVEGIRPKLEHGGSLAYELRPGIFKQIVTAAEKSPNERFVLIIDEINRGNVAKIFGELITLIEHTRRKGQDDETCVTLPYSDSTFYVPDNIYIIGTMNTADRSIQLLDTALRRRFTFVEMMPRPEHEKIERNIDGVDCSRLLATMNERIAALLDREHQIGHTYLFDVATIGKLADAFRNKIFPLLQEYFFNDWDKIRAVLGGNAFVTKKEIRRLSLESERPDDDRVIYERLPDDDPAWENPDQYRQIYDGEVATEPEDV